MNRSLSSAQRRYHALLRTLPCIVCRRIGNKLDRHVDIHHVAKGSSPQNDWLVVPLCREHHDPFRTGSGLHGMGEQRFCSMFKVPHLSEYGLLAWVNEDLCEKLTLRKVASRGCFLRGLCRSRRSSRNVAQTPGSARTGESRLNGKELLHESRAAHR